MYIEACIRKYVIGGADLPPPTLNRVKKDAFISSFTKHTEDFKSLSPGMAKGLFLILEFSSMGSNAVARDI